MMELGPIVRRDLVSMARRPRTYAERFMLGLMFLIVIGVCLVGWDLAGRDRVSIRSQTQFTLMTFGLVVALQLCSSLGTIPGQLAPVIAAERERKTLDALLSTQLTNADIILGLVISAMVRVLTWLSVFLLVMALMTLTWGLDPRLAGLALAAAFSVSFALVSLSLAVSVESPTVRQALSLAVPLWMAAASLPLLVVMLLPRLWPWAAHWLVPVVSPLIDVSPLVPFLTLIGMGRGRFLETTWRMIGLQLAGGVFLIMWAIVRLRRASRGLYDGATKALIRRLMSNGWHPRRPPCGTDPVLWYEKYRTQGRSRADIMIGRFIAISLTVLLFAMLFWLARPAWREARERGFRVRADLSRGPGIHDVHPLARWLVAGIHSQPPPGQARAEFNAVARQATAIFYLMFILVTMGFSAESITSERNRDTWSGLLATPLTGWEILRAKMLGALWRMRIYVGLTLSFWIVGAGLGAIHPAGLVLSFAGLIASGWFFAALGIYTGLWSKDLGPPSGMTILGVGLLNLGGLALFFAPLNGLSIFLGTASMPFIGWLSLLSYDDVDFVLSTGTFPRLAAAGITTGEGGRHVVGTCLIGIVGQLVGAYLLTRSAIRGFDRAVGRPIRQSVPGEHLSPLTQAPEALSLCTERLSCSQSRS
jgi:ABC-type transport system involved in multi-copper enzyme maturation permease subunit